MLDKKFVDILACPKCKSSLEYDSKKDILKCLQCRREFEIKNGIPILMIEENEQ